MGGVLYFLKLDSLDPYQVLVRAIKAPWWGVAGQASRVWDGGPSTKLKAEVESLKAQGARPEAISTRFRV